MKVLACPDCGQPPASTREGIYFIVFCPDCDIVDCITHEVCQGLTAEEALQEWNEVVRDYLVADCLDV